MYCFLAMLLIHRFEDNKDNHKDSDETILTTLFRRLLMKRVIANWSLIPKPVMKALNIKCLLGPFDFQPLKKFAFGILGHDEEEGLKFETDTDKIVELVTWVRAFHIKRGIPFLFENKSPVFTCMLSSPTPGKTSPEDDKFENAGLQRSKGYDFVWELRS